MAKRALGPAALLVAQAVQRVLPAEAVALEIGASWRTLEMLGILGVWVAISLVLAPLLVRRMIRGVSGSDVAKARERMLARGY